jgi:uncharacterized protein
MKTISELRAVIEREATLGTLYQRVLPLLSKDPAHDLNHALRVALSMLQLAGEKAEEKLAFRDVVAAALCHDLVLVEKNSPQRAAASGYAAEAAQILLGDLDFAPEAIATIAEAIRDHSYSRGAVPQSLLGRLLQDADRLDALGAIGIMRTVSTSVRMGASYFHPEDPWATRRTLAQRQYTIDHFFEKLLRLEGTMCTDAGRAEAARRTRIMQDFLDELAQELGEPRPSAT